MNGQWRGASDREECWKTDVACIQSEWDEDKTLQNASGKVMSRIGVNRGIGCMAVFPAGIIGFAGLTDGIGPTGWRGFSELFGWFTACLFTAALFALLLRRADRFGGPVYAFALAATAGVGTLAYELLNWLGHDAPMSAKFLFTSSMQVLGAMGTGLCLLLIANAVRKGERL